MEKYNVVISGYGNKHTVGFYQVMRNGAIKEDKGSNDFINPSFLQQVGDKWIVIEEKAEEGKVYLCEKENQTLKVLDTLIIEGSELCYVSYVEHWKCILGACYGTGDVFAIKIKENKLSFLSQFKQDKNEEGKSRAHCIVASPKSHHAYGVNIASDQIVSYTLNEEGLKLNDKFACVQLPKGVGPRHMVWHPTLHIAYVITEYSNQLFVLKWQEEDGSLGVMQTIDLMEKQTCESYGATVCINQKGNILYAANRGKDTITRFSINEEGTVNYEEETTTFGCWPRHITLTTDDTQLLIANQKSGKVSVVEVEKCDGKLGKLLGELEFLGCSFVAEW